MNWKRELQINDIAPEQILEFTCKQCASVYHQKAEQLQKHNELRFLWLDEIEKDAKCKQRLCYGDIRLSMCHDSANSGFVAGLA